MFIFFTHGYAQVNAVVAEERKNENRVIAYIMIVLGKGLYLSAKQNKSKILSQKLEQDITMKEKNHFFHITFHVSFPQIRLEYIIHKFHNDFG